MAHLRLILPSLAALTIGFFSTVGLISPASAQQPIATQTLLEEQLARLPQGLLCWDVRLGSSAPGSATPASGDHVHGWAVAYLVDGFERFTYADGRTGTVEAGQAVLFEADTPHRHESVGTVTNTNVRFGLTCEPLPNTIGNTGALPGLLSGAGPYQLQVRLRTWQPGVQTHAHVISGPTATFVLEGTIGRSTASGGGCSGPGELYVSPVAELVQNTNVGTSVARTLDVDVWPTGLNRTVPLPAEVQLPRPAC